MSNFIYECVDLHWKTTSNTELTGPLLPSSVWIHTLHTHYTHYIYKTQCVCSSRWCQ